MTTATPAVVRAPGRARRWPRRIGLALAGVVLGLVVAEWAFRIRDHHGFPKLNVYVADRELGVRLAPGAAQTLVFPGTHTTSVRINSSGYRGAAFPPPGPDDVVVVGDSQVFGLGVEERETFAAALERTLGGGRHVLNGGVPTYGPDEYAAVARELIAARHPRTVVFTINLVNDLFEATRPNRDRHVVRDGWAVRREVAGAVTGFPGRSWLARRSHLFFALRQVWHGKTDGVEVASEGTWRDLVASGGKSAAAQAEADQARATRGGALAAVEAQLDDQVQVIDDAIRTYLDDQLSAEDHIALEAGHRQPGDTVTDPLDGAEEAREVVVTAAHIRRGAALRTKLRDRLVQEVKARVRGAERARLLGTLASTPELEQRLDELTRQRIAVALESPLAPVVRALKADCDRAGVRLVLLVLPIDVAVSADEWKKYRATPIDMTSVGSLAADLAALGAELGVSTLDATAALRAAEPGAFLDHDIHMTPKGHAAVAAALAEVLAAPPPPAANGARGPVPVPAQWRARQEITVTGSTAARCETKVLGGWLRVLCVGDGYSGSEVPRAIRVLDDASATAMTMVMPWSAALVVAMAPGDHVRADIEWAAQTRRLDVTWTQGAPAPRGTLEVTATRPLPDDAHRRSTPTGLALEVCRCWAATYQHDTVGDPYCPGAYGALDDGCRAYQGDCAGLLACTRRDPARPPPATVRP